jgi:hypothetical protein
MGKDHFQQPPVIFVCRHATNFSVVKFLQSLSNLRIPFRVAVHFRIFIQGVNETSGQFGSLLGRS